MIAQFAPLAFVLAAALAAFVIGDSWRRYGGLALANLAALRELDDRRDFVVRIAALGRPALAGHPALRRAPHRPFRLRRPRAAVARRAAA